MNKKGNREKINSLKEVCRFMWIGLVLLPIVVDTVGERADPIMPPLPAPAPTAVMGDRIVPVPVPEDIEVMVLGDCNSEIRLLRADWFMIRR